MPLPVRWRYKIDRWRTKLGSVFHSEPKSLRPRLCPSCGTLVGATATKCHVCGASMRYSFAAASKTLARFLPQTSPVTYTILTVCCVLYGLGLVITTRLEGFTVPSGGLGGLFNLGAIAGQVNARLGESVRWIGYFNQPGDLQQPWRLVTAIFLHGSLLHIGFNMWVLMDIGPMVEELYGSARYLFFFVATGAFGYVVSSFIGNNSVGASGALLGLIGVLLAATSGRKNLMAQSLRSSLIRWIIYIAVFGLLFRGIDNAAHFGGLVAGYLLGRMLPDRPPADVAERKTADLLGWVAGIAVFVCFAFMVFNYLQAA